MTDNQIPDEVHARLAPLFESYLEQISDEGRAAVALGNVTTRLEDNLLVMELVLDGGIQPLFAIDPADIGVHIVAGEVVVLDR